MKDFLRAAKLLLLDLASTFFFLVLFYLTHNLMLSVCLGVALGLTQIGLQFARRKPIDRMEWLSLFLVVATGSVTLLTDDPRFVLMKPSMIYVIVGIAMLKPGWMNRYLPAIAKAVASDVAVIVGFCWAGLMFVSAALNVFVALVWSVPVWAMVMPAFKIGSKVILFVVGFAAIRVTVRRRLRAMPPNEREALLASTGLLYEPPLVKSA
ncbi:septation protein IspZ [Bradyrhizobium sp. 179]|uniref:inner membrane-spanning protein YciB n=1 Tax=Bradyrhizobium sp. 179 TaxID=2782648 RepID=UPI001FFA59F6|nr:septation protein IspZ [Bradyrhizobium sp. 179]MCK1542512.1 septation protein IspZ [Bradyrhizobium sp. 179]